jgi:tRNA-splicing ligase RtcB
MSHHVLKGNGAPIRTWIPPEQIESSAIDQLRKVAELPFTVGVAVMPDVHAGIGATVGSVIAMDGAVAPMAVGVDIGCGMDTMLTDLTERDLAEVSLAGVRAEIERLVPIGIGSHGRPQPEGTNDSALWQDFQKVVSTVRVKEDVARAQVGSLGSGNHFIEVCLDLKGRVWVLLHSGSRHIGKTIADVHTRAAKCLDHNSKLGDLAVLLAGSPEFDAYWHDLQWAQKYAAVNRMTMMRLIHEALDNVFGRRVKTTSHITCHHNYAARYFDPTTRRDVILTRKGAINAFDGVEGIIPGSMGTRSYIVRGRGNAFAYDSASHGAGRTMSRGEAKRRFTVEDVAQQTAGVECRKDKGIVDEIPSAYKDIDVVMEHQRDLVEITDTLRAVLCVKG